MVTEFRMEYIFQDFKPKDRNDFEKEKKIFDKKRKKWISSKGDIISLYNVYEEFKKHEYDIEKKNRNTKEVIIISKKLGGTKEWCYENSLNYNKLRSIKYKSKELYSNFMRNIVNVEKEKIIIIKIRNFIYLLIKNQFWMKIKKKEYYVH